MKLQITILLLLFIVAGGGSVVIFDKINQQDRKAEKLGEIIDGKTINAPHKEGCLADAPLPPSPPPVEDRSHCFEEKFNRIERDINENNADDDFERVDKELEKALDELNRAMEDL